MTFAGSNSLKVSALLLLSLGTILFFNFYDRYVVTGPELLLNNHFQNNLAKWEHSTHGVSIQAPGNGVARIDSDNNRDIVDLRQVVHVARHYSLLKLSCEVKTLNLPQGQGSWNTARILLVLHDQNAAPMYHLPHALTILHGTHDWERHVGVFPVTPNAVKAQIFFQLAQTTGTIWVKNPSLQPVAEALSFQKYRNGATLLWIVVGLWIAVPLIKSAFLNIHHAAIVALALIIILGVLMPESLKEEIGSSMFPSLVEPSAITHSTGIFKFTPLLPALDIYKVGHFVMFAILAVVTFSRRLFQISPIQISIYLLLFALVTEILQLLVDGRSAQLGDVLIDGAGIAAGVMLLRIARVFRLAPD